MIQSLETAYDLAATMIFQYEPRSHRGESAQSTTSASFAISILNGGGGALGQ